MTTANEHTTNGTTPAWLKVDGDAIPAELKQYEQWVNWRALPPKTPGAKPRKVPYDPVNRRNAKSDDPATWNHFGRCWGPYLNRFPYYAGIGFVFAADDEYAGIDLDNCRNPETGELHPAALAFLANVKSYAEVSPSRTGVKIIIKGKLPDSTALKHKAAIDGIEFEVYDRGRYFALTGSVIDDEHREVIDAQEALDDIVARIQAAHESKATPTADPILPPAEKCDTAGRPSDDAIFRRALKRAISIPVEKENDGSRRLLKVCIIAVEMDLSEADTIRLVGEVHHLAPFPNEFDERDILRRLADAERKTQRSKSLNADTATPASSAPPSGDKRLSMRFADNRTERANAKRYMADHGPNTRYCGPWEKFLAFNGRYWEVDERRTVEAWAKDVAAKLWPEVGEIHRTEDTPETLKQAVVSFAKSTNSANGIRNMLALVKSEPSVPVLPRELDAQPWLFNVENGTLDLQNGKLHPHRRKDLLTKLAPVVFDPAAKCPLWLEFLDRIMTGDQALISFLQRAVGMSLTGIVRDHCLLFCYGTGANGKGVFLNTIKRLMGDDYALNAPPELLLVKPQGGTHPTEMASLHGKRFVAASEVDDGRRFAEATLKTLTGGDPVTARRCYEDFWTFEPQHHLWVAANHRPGVRGNDFGVWRRIKLIPFAVTIPPEEQDGELPEKLLGELSGILNWALQGCRDWQDYGLHEPDVVKAATAEYRADMDVVGEFLAEKCAIDVRYEISAANLYGAYKEWGDETGEHVMSQRRFGRQLTERGFTKHHSGGTQYRGLTLRNHLKF